YRVDVSGLRVESNIKDVGLKLDYDYRPNTLTTIRFGANLTNHDFKPNLISLKGEVVDINKGTAGKLIRNQELAFYGSYDREVTEALKFTAGLRLSSSFVKDAAYARPEPRFAARYALSKATSVKIGYARMNQYLHLVGSSNVSLPSDIWYPTTKKIKPGQSDQASVGVFHYLQSIRTNISIEGYYKWMQNLIEYREGAVLLPKL
ncbi:MAG: hypothetical protein RLZZ292_3901, partial [Bacteroidota bacterium]